MNCIVVEDEPAAQAILAQNISLCPGLTCLGFFPDAFEAQSFLDSTTVDLMFLDINLPAMSGVSFLKSLVNPPLVIFTTAYPQYALEGFDLEIVDFLLKPFSFERFSKAVNKAKERLHFRAPFTVSDRISVKADKRIYQIAIPDLLCAEACGDYVTLYFADKKLVVHGTLKGWEEKLKRYPFHKVHRTTLVNILKIDHIAGNLIHIGPYKMPLAESCRESLMGKMFRLPG